MTTWEATATGSTSYELGEGPRWDAGDGLLRWVDILGARVHVGRLDGTDVVALSSWAPAPAPPTISAVVAPAYTGSERGTLLAAHDRLVVVDVDGEVHELVRLLDQGEGRRLNDAVTDPAGRLLVGSGPLGERTYDERLWLVDHDGTVTVVDDDLGLSNGIAFTADGRTLYTVDTFRHRVSVREYDPTTGTSGERREHLAIDDGYPDGLAVDAEGHLWVAVFGQSEVRRFAPDGRLVDVVRTPEAPQATSMCFAGADLRTLVITTAREDMSDADVSAHPASGRLFTTRVDVPGLPSRPWRGRPRPSGER